MSPRLLTYAIHPGETCVTKGHILLLRNSRLTHKSTHGAGGFYLVGHKPAVCGRPEGRAQSQSEEGPWLGAGPWEALIYSVQFRVI